MRRRLPPFAALKAFEATARHLNFSRAADELGVTQAAVSRQVRVLEDFLGVNVIERQGKLNNLTNAGKLLLREFRSSLDIIENAVSQVSSVPGKSLLTVSVSPFFSSTWLTPRIMSFIENNPKIDLRLHHAYFPPDYDKDQIDLGINWGDGKWPGVTSEKVIDGSLTPVCSVDYHNKSNFSSDPKPLLGKLLLYEFDKKDWIDWFLKFDIKIPERVAVSQISDSNALRRAALEGHGVALFFDEFAKEDINIGKLYKPFDVSVDTGNHYFLNYPEDRELTSYAKLFRRWVFSELEGLKE